MNKSKKLTKSQTPIKFSGIVVMVDNDYSRCTWKLEKIVQTYPGLDGKIEVVDVKYEPLFMVMSLFGTLYIIFIFVMKKNDKKFI